MTLVTATIKYELERGDELDKNFAQLAKNVGLLYEDGTLNHYVPITIMLSEYLDWYVYLNAPTNIRIVE